MPEFNSKLKKFGVARLAIILLLIVILITAYGRGPSSNISKEELNKFIGDKMIECGNQGNNACYKNMADILATDYKIKDVLEIFEQNENNPIFFAKCHTTLHFLGQEAYKIAKNTSRALAEGTPICFAGFYHGVLEAYLTEKDLINNETELAKVIPNLCGTENNFAVKKIYNECLHGLGHALMFATGDNLPTSLKLCDALKSEADRNWCYSGSFMENSTSSTNKDHPSKYLKSDDPMYPCNILESKYGNTCYMLQSFYFAEISKYDWGKTEKLCKQIPKEYQAGCFNAIGQTLVGFTQDLKVMRDSCYSMENKNDRISCLYGIIGGLGERYNDGWSRVLTFCNDTVAEEDKSKCYYRAIESSRNWISDENTLRTFCSQIDAKTARNQCLIFISS